MKAIQMTGVGDPEVLTLVDIPTPVPGDDEIRLRLHAAGVNPIDTKIRRRGVFFDNALPAVLGCDGAGTVESIGKAVTSLRSY